MILSHHVDAGNQTLDPCKSIKCNIYIAIYIYIKCNKLLSHHFSRPYPSYFYCMYTGLLPVSVYHLCAVPAEARRGHHTTGN